MSEYIGNQPATAFETVQKQISTSNSGTTITLDRAVTSVQDILLTIDAVVQSYDNYSVSGTTLTVGGTLSNNRVEILYVGRTMQSVDPTDDSVSASKIKTDAVTTAKVQNDAITVDKLNLISTSSVPSLEAKGDGSSQDGYIQLNCSQNSHGVKLKSPPHSANQSYTLTLPSTAPATDKMLQTNSSGVLSFVDAPSGAMTLIASAEGTNSVGDVSINDCFSATYANYLITFAINNDRSGNYNNFRFQKDDDTTFNSDYNYCLWGYDENGNLRTSFSNSGSACPLNSLETPDDDSWVFGSCTGYMYVYHPYTLTTGGLRRLRAIGQVFNINTTGEVSGQSLQMQLKQNSSNVAGIRFRPSANYITERRVRVYGLKDS